MIIWRIDFTKTTLDRNIRQSHYAPTRKAADEFIIEIKTRVNIHRINAPRRCDIDVTTCYSVCDTLNKVGPNTL